VHNHKDVVFHSHESLRACIDGAIGGACTCTCWETGILNEVALHRSVTCRAHHLKPVICVYNNQHFTISLVQLAGYKLHIMRTARHWLVASTCVFWWPTNRCVVLSSRPYTQAPVVITAGYMLRDSHAFGPQAIPSVAIIILTIIFFFFCCIFIQRHVKAACWSNSCVFLKRYEKDKNICLSSLFLSLPWPLGMTPRLLISAGVVRTRSIMSAHKEKKRSCCVCVCVCVHSTSDSIVSLFFKR